MTVAKVPAFILELAQKAAVASGAKSVYLFGSYARGEAKPDSDVDLLLVMDDNANLRDSSLAATRANQSRNCSVDFISMHRTHFVNRDSIIALEVAREGILLLETPLAVAVYQAKKSFFVQQFMKMVSYG